MGTDSRQSTLTDSLAGLYREEEEAPIAAAEDGGGGAGCVNTADAGSSYNSDITQQPLSISVD